MMTRTRALFLPLFLSLNSWAADVAITVKDTGSNPVSNIVVSLHPDDPALLEKHQAGEQKPAIMDQIDRQFLPHILPIAKSSLVSFPNSDSIKHHVYSFSKAKPFELRLYKDRKPQPMLFENAGEVALGCNIHDWMLGYIYVVDSPWFGKTLDQGSVHIKDVPSGSYTLKVWSPLLQGEDKEIAIAVNIDASKSFTVPLSQELLPSLNEYEEGDELDEY